MGPSSNRWTSFWFAPVAPAQLALCRIAWSAMCLFHLSTSGIQERIEAFDAAAPEYVPLPILSILSVPFGGPHALSAALLRALLYTIQCAGILALAGLGTRFVLPLFALGTLLVQSWAYSSGVISHDISLVQWGLFLLAFTPCGAAWSLDAWRARAKGNSTPAGLPVSGAGWPLRVVHVLLALAYLSAGMTKLARGAEEWFSGYTLQYYLSFHALRSQSEPGLWLMRHHGLMVAGASALILFETSFVLSLWVRRLAWIWAIGSLLVHTGASVCMGVHFPSFPLLALTILPWSSRLERKRARAFVSPRASPVEAPRECAPGIRDPAGVPVTSECPPRAPGS